MGTLHKTKVNIFEKLQFLFEGTDIGEVSVNMDEEGKDEMLIETIVGPEQVITDNQEYYEVSEVSENHLIYTI